MCTKSQLSTILSTVKREAERIFGDKLVEVVLYGSYARGDNDDESDIDIMVRVNIEKENLYPFNKKLSMITSRLGVEHDILVSIHLQDNYTFERFKKVVPFYNNVINEGIVING